MSDQKPGLFDTSLLEEFPPPGMEAWRSEVRRLLGAAGAESRLRTVTPEGIELEPLYTRAHVAGLTGLEALPGAPPYRRGWRRAGDAATSWEVAQEIAAPTPEGLSAALLADLQRGQSAAVLVLDEASRDGLDPREARASQVGAGGTSIPGRLALARAFEGVDPETVAIHLVAGSSSVPAAALLAAWLSERGSSAASWRGSAGFDPLAALAVRGRLPLTLDRAFDELALLTGWGVRAAPHLATLAVAADVYHDAGGSAVHELAYALASAVELLRQLESRGVAIEESAARLRFTFAVGSQLFMEVAKLRAARALWCRVLESARISAPMRIHARTARRNKTLFDRETNALRATTEAFAAIVGGCDSLHVAPCDEPLGPPSPLSRRLARNTQLVLREECRLDRLVDPAGGSWLVERLTSELMERAWSLFQQVEAAGGMAVALRAGTPQAAIHAAAAERDRRLATGRDVLVGTSRYANPGEGTPVAASADHASWQALAQRSLAAGRRPEGEVLAALDRVLDSGPERRVEALVEAARCGASLGELVKVLRAGDGEPRRVPALRSRRTAAPFEDLRRDVLAWRGRRGAGAQVYVAPVGEPAELAPRVDFARSFFESGGFEVEVGETCASTERAAAAAEASHAAVVAIVAGDDRWGETARALAGRLERARPGARIFLTGDPGGEESALRAAGVDGFVHRGCDVPAMLGALARELGARP